MTDRTIPSPEARARVQTRSEDELRAFFEEISAPAVRPLVPYLPRVDGFRRGSPAGIVKQKETLARRLRRPTANESDYKALYMLWRAWIDETQPNAPLIQRLIDELEEAADKADGPEARGLVIEQHTDSLFQTLKEESEQNRCTREGIERLYTFSPLPETTAARGIIAAAKLAEDVTRDTTYRNLPTRLDQDEREIQAAKTELKVLVDRVANISDQCSKTVRELPSLREAIREARVSADAARAAVNQIVDKPADDHDSGRAEIEARIKALTDDLQALGQSVGELASNLDSIKQWAEAARKLEHTQDKSAQEQKHHSSQIDKVTVALGQLRREVDALLEDRTQANRIQPHAEQIGELGHRVDATVAQLQPSHQIEHSVRRAASVGGALYWASLPAVGNLTVVSSIGDLVTAFAGALLPLGMRKSGAQLLAEECTAAIVARQAVLLQGAFASRVAQVLAGTSGGAAGARLAMPIGVLDAGQLRLAVEEAFASLKEGVGGLAIEGINHVPFDLVREIIADCVAPPALPNAPYRRIAVFATLSRGVASLPIEPETLELGPVFDLDYLDWRTNPPPASPPQGSFLPAKTDQAIFAQLANAGGNAEEAGRLAQALARKRNPGIERSVVRAYRALHLTRSDQKMVTPLQSLFYGWLLPYWRALGLSKEEVDSEFDGGKVHGAPLDGRLTAIFATEFPDSKKGAEA